MQTFDLISVDGLPQPPALRRGAQSAATADADAEQDETDDFAPRGPRPTSILQWSETGAGLKRADSARSRKMVMHVGAGEDVNRRGPPPNDAPEEVTENEDEWETKEIHEDSGNPPDAVTSEASSEHAPEASAHDAKEEDTAPLAPAQGQPATAETPAPEKEEASVSTLAEEASPEPSSAASASQQSEEGSKDEQSSAPALEAEKEFAEPEIVPSDSTASAVSESEKEPEPEPGSEAEAPASTEAPTAEGLAGGELAPSAAHPELDAPAPKEEAAASADPDAAAGADAGIAPTPAPAESEVELGEVKIEEEEQGADVKEEE